MSDVVEFKDPECGPVHHIPRYGGIIGWWCPVELRLVDISHFHLEGNDHTPMPTLLIDAVLEDFNRPKVGYHAGPNTSFTTGTTCPRETLLSRFVGVNPSPTSFNSIHWGKAMHAYLEKIDNGGWFHEFAIPPRSTVGFLAEGINCVKSPPKMFDGIPIHCTIDRVKKDLTEIEDYKTMGDRAYSFHINKSPGTIKADTAAQLNVYRIALEKTLDAKVETMRAWYGSMTAAGMVPWDKCYAPVMNEAQIAAICPGGGNFSFGQIIHIIHAAFRDMRKLVEAKDFQKMPIMEARAAAAELATKMIEQIPLVGEGMYGGQKCYKYCMDPRACAGIGYLCDGVKLTPPTGPASKRKVTKPGKSWLDRELDNKKPKRMTKESVRRTADYVMMEAMLRVEPK